MSVTWLVLRTHSLRATPAPLLPFVHSLLTHVASTGPAPDAKSLALSYFRLLVQ